MNLLLCLLLLNFSSRSEYLSHEGVVQFGFSSYENPTHREMESHKRIKPAGNKHGLTIGNGLFLFQTLGVSVNAYSFYEGGIMTEWGPSIRYSYGNMRASLNQGVGLARLGMTDDHLKDIILHNVKVTSLSIGYLVERQEDKKLWLSLSLREVSSLGTHKGEALPDSGAYQLISAGISWNTHLL